MKYDERFYGCIPNAATPDELSRLESISCPWDSREQPRITTWESYNRYLEDRAYFVEWQKERGKYRFWWETCRELGNDPETLLIASQGNIGSCAGVSYFDRCFQITLLKQIAAESEQTIEPVNSLISWLISKDWSARGGQSIAAVVRTGVDTGVFPASKVGAYSTTNWEKKTAEEHRIEAESRQMGACLVPNEVDKVEAIELSLRAGHVVEIGNSVGVTGCIADKNGVLVAQLGGRWSHATMFSEIQNVNGTTYFRWENSHGLIYGKTGTEPRFGCWMTRTQVEQFCASDFCDIAVVTYVESPYSTKLTPTLVPEV